mmetsp:Transcript_88135/g.254240  ORF Transcript_88135/g.254240 Transcript_88135/m.254240 type:complete len:127 (-) Transcript_88135:2-382(-)
MPRLYFPSTVWTLVRIGAGSVSQSPLTHREQPASVATCTCNAVEKVTVIATSEIELVRDTISLSRLVRLWMGFWIHLTKKMAMNRTRRNLNKHCPCWQLRFQQQGQEMLPQFKCRIVVRGIPRLYE